MYYKKFKCLLIKNQLVAIVLLKALTRVLVSATISQPPDEILKCCTYISFICNQNAKIKLLTYAKKYYINKNIYNEWKNVGGASRIS